MSLILQAILVALIGGILFSIIGVIPGTDETATMAPITLILVLMGFEPVVLFAWFIAIIVAMQITHTVPTAMAALPGSTMAVPMVEHCNTGKMLGIPHITMRKMAAGSIIGSVIGLPIAVCFAQLLAPFSDIISAYSGLIFTVAACIIAYMSKSKWGAVVTLIPFAFLIQGLQRLSVEAVGGTLFTSIFMGITIGPMICELFNALVPANREKNRKDGYKEIWLAPDAKDKLPLFPNPLKIVHKSTVKYIVPCAAVSACTFTFSPVGMTVMLGELVASKKKELFDRVTAAVGVQDAVSNATYLGEFIIPIIAFGLPLSPVALGPDAPLFNDINLHDFLSMGDYLIYGFIGIICGAIFAYPIAIKKARSWSEAMFRHISHEALIGAFMGLIFMLAFHEAGLLGILVTLIIGIFGGFLNNYFGIHTGVQFMAYYASGWIVTNLMVLCGILA